MTAPFEFSIRAKQTDEPPISNFIQQAVENPGLISLAAGLVDEDSLPTAEVLRFSHDHAMARDAVHQDLDVDRLERDGLGILHNSRGSIEPFDERTPPGRSRRPSAQAGDQGITAREHLDDTSGDPMPSRLEHLEGVRSAT